MDGMIHIRRKRLDTHHWLRLALEERGLLQVDLARAWGISEASVSRFIIGTENPDPVLSRVVKLADLLNVTLESLAHRIQNPSSRRPLVARDPLS